MPDVLTREQRSYNMSRIHGKNTKIELNIRRMLREKGIKNYRIHYNLLGKPDIVFPKGRVAVFIDGCFWHRCPLHFVEPKTNRDFWMNKIDGNVKRDKSITKSLEDSGWIVLRFWEHQANTEPERVVCEISDRLGCSKVI